MQSDMNELITLNNLQKTFVLGNKQIEVIKGLSCSFNEGEMVSITGVSGVGKSTLLHLLGTLDRPSDGEILYDRVNPFMLTPPEIAHFRNHMIGFIFQAHHLLPEFSACENIMIPLLINRYSRKQALNRALELLEEVGLSDRIHHKPGELSGGEQQRVAVARSLVNNPRVILADEPTGNLDVNTGRSIHRLLRDINRDRGITFVIATHNLHFAAETDRQFQLIDGKLRTDLPDLGEQHV